MPGAAIVYVTDAPHNAKGDVKSTTGTITSGTSSLTVPSGVFAAGDIGKQILVVGAGPTITNGGDSAVIPLYTTISNVAGTTVTLAATASASVTNAVVQFGTDDTPAFQSAATAIQNQGGGELRIPPATYWLYPNSRTLPTNGTGAGDFTSLSGVRVVGPGATLLTARAGNYMVGFNLFTFQDCSNVQVIGVRVQGHLLTGTSGSLVQQGANLVKLFGGCRNVEVQASATGILSLVSVVAGPRGGNSGTYAGTDAQRSHGIRFSLVAVNCGYGCDFQFSGDGVDGSLTTDGCYRSLIAYGVRDHRLRVDSRNHIGADVVLTAYTGYGVANVDLSYTNRLSSNSYGVGYGTAGVELAYGDNTAAVIRDVRIHYDVKYLAPQAFGPALRVINHGTNETPPIHQLERLRLEGRIEGPGDPFDFNYQVVSADRAHVYADFRDFLFTDLTLSGNRPVVLDLTPLVDGLEIHRVRGLMRGS